jgi:putative nucleotidyltransferase with HDIG domain
MDIIANKDWKSLLATYSWVRDMQGVPQDARHHAEGDVAIHTQMVLEALTAQPAYRALNAHVQDAVWTAALLHDVEKRSTTFREEDGSIVSPGHAKKGAATARQLLLAELHVPFATREAIVGLVRFHGLPLWVMHKPDPLKALLEASLAVNTEWLCLLARADVLGRICGDRAELLERIDFFEAYCIEQECYGQPRAFATDAARFRYFHRDDVSPLYVPFEDAICEVTLMSGLPGMGKDSYISRHCPDMPVVSLDDIRRAHKLKPDDKSATGWVAQQAKEQARVYLRAKQDFVWNATNITRQMRSQLIDLFADYGARVKIVYVEKPYNEWQAQNRDREYAVPAAVLNKLLHKLEVPLLSEAHEVVYVVD